MLKAFLPACHTYTCTCTHACTHSLTNTGYIGSVPKEGKSDKLFFFPSFSVELCQSFAPCPLNRSTLTVCFTGQDCEVFCFHWELGSQMYTLIRCYAFFLVSHTHRICIPPRPPFSLLGSVPWQGGQSSCDSAVVCRMRSARGSLGTGRQPTKPLSQVFNSMKNTWSHLPDLKWPPTLFRISPRVLTPHHWMSHGCCSYWLWQLSLLLLIPSPPLCSCSFNASYSSYCMVIRGTWSDGGSLTALWSSERQQSWK